MFVNEERKRLLLSFFKDTDPYDQEIEINSTPVVEEYVSEEKTINDDDSEDEYLEDESS